jgi:hypothetical protein
VELISDLKRALYFFCLIVASIMLLITEESSTNTSFQIWYSIDPNKRMGATVKNKNGGKNLLGNKINSRRNKGISRPKKKSTVSKGLR